MGTEGIGAPIPSRIRSRCHPIEKEPMLIGEYEHTLDDKKRITLPKAFSKTLGKKVILTHGLDGCLWLIPESGWTPLLEQLQTLSIGQADARAITRYFVGGAFHLETDGAGRILIPEELKQSAGLKKTVVFAGVSNRVEVWDATLWKQYKARIAKQADAIAEKLGELGVL